VSRVVGMVGDRRMRIVVTGGAGFIGANLVKQLSATGAYDVVVLDNICAGQQTPIFPSDVQFVQGDFANKTIMAKCLQDVDTVIHLAALSGVIDSVKDPRPSFEINVAGSFQLLELACAAKVRRFINASTGGALIGETALPITEKMAPFPLSPYGASKLAVEGYCSAFTGAYGLACATLRFSNVYGPRSAHKRSVIASFIKSIIRDEPLIVYGDGTQQRDYLYVGDLVCAIETALNRQFTGVYQLGSGQPTTLHMLIAMLNKISGRDFQIRYVDRRCGEVHSTWCDISKAAREFNYCAPTTLEAGLQETWFWYLENQEIWARQIVLSASD
jgi:UDP-glucose 4-epimerase